MNTALNESFIAERIYYLRGEKVMLDYDLAALYGIETRVLHQAVRRNAERFPEDFMFEVPYQEIQKLMSQTVISSWAGGGKTSWSSQSKE